MFNVWAFLFGSIYLLIKGMWRPALFYLGVGVVLVLIVVVTGITGPVVNGLGLGLSALISQRSNALYYRKMVLGQERAWC